MDSIISGVIGTALFLLFVGGLAQSIHAIPFTIIVIVISGAAIYGLYEDIREERKSK